MTNETNNNKLTDEEIRTILAVDSLDEVPEEVVEMIRNGAPFYNEIPDFLKAEEYPEEGIAYYYSESEISRRFDEALLMGGNVLIDGLTGSGKTACAKEWLKIHSGYVNGLYFNCDGIKTPIGLITLHDDLILCGQIFDDETIDNMLKEDFVAVFDNYHNADEAVKQHILLLCDGFVVDGRMPDRIRRVDTRRFVACIRTTGL